MISTGFFLTPPAKKLKLKDKTQPLGGLSLPYAKLKKETKLMKFSPQKSKFFKGWYL